MKKIDLEAHFITEGYVAYLRARTQFPKLETIEDEKHQKFDRLWYRPDLCQARSLGLSDRLLDLGEGRIKEMDAAGIDCQALSLTDPGCEPFDAPDATAVARETNDELVRAVKKYPDRFIGLAALAPQNPDEAADELERGIKELGFRGAKINSNIRGEYLDDRKYWTIFERAEKLGVPIYLHPTVPSPAMLGPYAAYGYTLTSPSLGFGAETALHAMRLICSGLFDKYPGLKIILGHLGEGLPFWLNRLNLGWLRPLTPGELGPKCVKKPSEYIKTNFMVTTSGMFFQPAFLCVYLALGADNITFATDHPFVESKPAGQFMEALSIGDNDKDKICHLNAERLFKLGI
jgi:2,3-dihydroxybenzoate decarboxylase